MLGVHCTRFIKYLVKILLLSTHLVQKKSQPSLWLFPLFTKPAYHKKWKGNYTALGNSCGYYPVVPTGDNMLQITNIDALSKSPQLACNKQVYQTLLAVTNRYYSKSTQLLLICFLSIFTSYRFHLIVSTVLSACQMLRMLYFFLYPTKVYGVEGGIYLPE